MSRTDRSVIMASLQPQTPDSDSTQHWLWLGQQILQSRPSNVRILCLEFCTVDLLLHMFVSAGITWSLYTRANYLPTAHHWDVVLILTDSPTETEHSIIRTSEALNAFKARYLLVHYNKIEEKVIKDIATLAWSLGLSKFSTVLLQNHAVFVTQPRCPGRPRVIQDSSVQWPDLKKVDLNDCTLRIAVADLKPLSSYNDRNKPPKGALQPFFEYIQSVLHFKAQLVRSHHYNISESVLLGQADIAFFQFNLKPNMTIDVAGAFRSRMTWCVPNKCRRRKFTNILWMEFSENTWAMIVFTVFAMSCLVWFMASELSFSASVLRVFAIFSSSSTKLPSGAARGPLLGWILGMVVLATCYQTELHSLMTAPSFVRKIHNLNDLVTSEMALTCSKDIACPLLRILAKENETAAALAAKVKEIELTTLVSPLLPSKKQIAVLTSAYLCRKYLRRMRTLNNYQLAQTMMLGFYGVAPHSYLAPRLHRLYSHLEYSGIGRLWLKGSRRTCNKEEEGPKPLTTYHYKSAYILLACGFGLATIVFVFEVAVNCMIAKYSKMSGRTEAIWLQEKSDQTLEYLHDGGKRYREECLRQASLEYAKDDSMLVDSPTEPM